MTEYEAFKQAMKNRPIETWERFQGTLTEAEAEAWALRQPRMNEKLLRAGWMCTREGLPLNETNIWKKVIEQVGTEPMTQIAMLDGTPAEQFRTKLQQKRLSDWREIMDNYSR